MTTSEGFEFLLCGILTCAGEAWWHGGMVAWNGMGVVKVIPIDQR